MSAFEVLTMGRVGVDLYPQQVGVHLEDVETFAKYLGGSATNVAVAAARYQRRTAVITRTGDDPFGRFVHRALKGYGIDDRFVSSVPGLPTPVTFCEIFPPDDFPLYFYRWPKAPDLEIYAKELDYDAIRAAGVFWVTGTGLCDEPSRTATLAALEAREKQGITVLDLDYRPMFWESREQARTWIAHALPYVTVAVGNLDECDTAVGEREPLAAAHKLHDFGVSLAVVKQGPKGVLAHDRTTAVEVPPVPVNVLNGLGAGDAFGGALCHGLLAGWDVERVMRFANAAGAIVAGRLACSDAMPTAAEVTELLAEGPREDIHASDQRPRGPRPGSHHGGAVHLAPGRQRRPADAGMRVDGKLYIKAGSGAEGAFDLVVTPETAGWAYSGLRVLKLAPGQAHTWATENDELLVLPLSGSALVTCEQETFELQGRRDVFSRVTDFAYAPRDSIVTVTATAGGVFAICSARCSNKLPPRYGPAEQVPVELRGAGQASRQVNNFCSPGVFDCDKLIAVEVLTPGGNWSSWPPHKHDETREDESELEEIYYFETPGLGYQRVYGTAARPVDVLAEVRAGDVVLVPHGWHGPSIAAPGYPLYYLNVMAGPADERIWRFCDDPVHAWIRGTWRDQDIDPRLPMTSTTPRER